ncbi:MAG: helix-turn-helix domain-containing protein [Clostridiales bacterium]|nr:helix-turn-helix domain-containing protein [Clostridiales bacterium]
MLNTTDKKILQIILEAEHPVTNGELSAYCDVAVNTIRKEIVLINKESEKYGFRIASRSAFGNYIEMTDPVTAEPYLSRLLAQLQRGSRMGARYSSQVYYLTRRCLCGSRLTVEQLCRELYCSRKLLSRDLDSVKEILQKFNLTLVNRRNGQGLVVEGNEWMIRQCLIYQHKIYIRSVELGENKRAETEFRSFFYMTDSDNFYAAMREELRQCLREENYYLPVFCFPKIVHYLLLSFSRQKKTGLVKFTDEQKKRARNLSEYAIVQKFRSRISHRFHKEIPNKDILGLTMLLSSYGSSYHRPEFFYEYSQLREEACDFIRILCDDWGLSEAYINERMYEDWIGFLYNLRNRQIFEVYMDSESMKVSERRGALSPDYCIVFARFYQERHSVHLSREDVPSVFPLLDQIYPERLDSYLAPNILVTSQYGRPQAEILAADIRRGYRNEVGNVAVCEIGQSIEQKQKYDLLITDLDPERYYHVTDYELPVLSARFLPGKDRSRELDHYLEKLQCKREKTIITPDCFHDTDFQNKEELLTCLAGRVTDWWHGKYNTQKLLTHLRENDSWIQQRWENGIVHLPVLIDASEEQDLVILINKRPLPWEGNLSRIFVCYDRCRGVRKQVLLNDILRRFEQLSPMSVNALSEENHPLQILYPEQPVFMNNG